MVARGSWKACHQQGKVREANPFTGGILTGQIRSNQKSSIFLQRNAESLRSFPRSDRFPDLSGFSTGMQESGR
jgi:hypothetical protein